MSFVCGIIFQMLLLNGGHCRAVNISNEINFAILFFEAPSNQGIANIWLVLKKNMVNMKVNSYPNV